MINKHSKPVLTAQSVYSPFDLARQGVYLIFTETILLELPLSATSRWGEVTKWMPSCTFDGGILGSALVNRDISITLLLGTASSMAALITCTMLSLNNNGQLSGR